VHGVLLTGPGYANIKVTIERRAVTQRTSPGCRGRLRVASYDSTVFEKRKTRNSTDT